MRWCERGFKRRNRVLSKMEGGLLKIIKFFARQEVFVTTSMKCTHVHFSGGGVLLACCSRSHKRRHDVTIEQTSTKYDEI